MADNTVNVRLQSAYKTSADWDTLNPVLKNGEVGYVSNPASMYGWYKIGNGTSTWKQLPYGTAVAADEAQHATSAATLDDTEFIEDNEPYLSKTTPREASNKEYYSLVGATVTWNQLVHGDFGSDYATYWNVYSGTGSVNDGVLTVTDAVGRNGVKAKTGYGLPSSIAGHYLLFSVDYKSTVNLQIYAGWIFNLPASANFVRNIQIKKANETQSEARLSLDFFPSTAGEIGTFSFANFQITDLTLMFANNPAIADYAYSLEQSEAGSGIAWLKSYGFFTKDYYTYNPGELISVNTSGKKIVGFNQWDERCEKGYYNINTGLPVGSQTQIRAKNPIPIFGGCEYYCLSKDPIGGGIWALFYDQDGNVIDQTVSTTTAGKASLINNKTFVTPSNAKWMRFYFVTDYGTIYKNDVCINISDPQKNGTYKPYVTNTYPIDNIDLRGLFKMSNGKLYCEGDTYKSNGMVTRNFEYRAYQSGDESLADAITDGTHTVVKLAMPTTESATPYTSPIDVEAGGTEEFVDSRSVPIPVGNNSRYPKNDNYKLVNSPAPPGGAGDYIVHTDEYGKSVYERANTVKVNYAGTADLGMRRVFIQGTQTTATTTGKWTGDASPYFNSADDLVDGQEITYWVPLPTTGNVTLNLKFGNGTSSGEVNCYYGNTSRLTTHYGQGQAVHLTYRKNVKIPSTGTNTYTGWWADANYDSNSNTIDVLQGTYTIPVAGATAGLKQYSLFAEDANGKYSSFTTQNGTAVNKTINRTDYFDISKIYYSATSGNYATNGNIGTSVFRWAAALVDLRYTLNIANGTNGLTARKPLYLKFDAASSTIGTEGRPCYKLAGTAVNDWWTQTLSTNYDDHDIIYVKVSEAVYDWYRADLDVQQRFYRFTGNTVINGYDAVVALQSEYARNANYATCVDWACLPATAADRGLNITSNKIGHIKSVTATANISGSASINPGLGGTFAVPYFSIDSYGHTTASGAKTITLPSTSDIAGVTVNNATNATNASKVNNVAFGSASTMASGAFKSSSYAPTRAEILSPIGVGCDYTGDYSVAIHHYTTASKNYSFAAGDSTITPRNYSAVFGSYNASTASSMTIFDIGVGQVNQRVSAFMADIRGGSIVSDLIFASKVSGNKLGEQNCGIPRQPSIRQEYAVVNSWPAFLESDTSHMLTTADDLVTTSMYALGVITPKRHAMGEGAVSPSTYLSKLRGIRDSFNTYSVPFTNTISGTGTVTGSVNITFPFTFYKQPIAIYISIGGSIQLSGESITDDFGGKSACAIVDPQLHINGSYNVPATGATTASVAYRLRGFDSGNKTVKGNILILFD